MKPILFNTEMVRAIREDRKTVTRRVVKPQPASNTHPNLFVSPPYHPGDILWVRETWWKNYEHKYGTYFYRADGEEIDIPLITGGAKKKGKSDGLKWHPSIHMPKEAARLFLRVTGVRVERLQKISIEDAVSEGCITPKQTLYVNHKGYFSDLWNSTIKPADLPRYGWDSNPWVWVIEFERISKEAAIGGGGDG